MSTPLFCNSATASHVGKVREINEDSLLARPEVGLWVIADGMGGHGGGDLASNAVVTALATIEAPDSAADLLARFEDRMIRVNADLRALARSRGARVIGTTVVAILIHGAHYACVWCGDSRAYLLRGGVLTQISRDHSEVQDLIDRGILEPKEAKSWPRRNVITRALGTADQAALEIGDGPISARRPVSPVQRWSDQSCRRPRNRRAARRRRSATGLRAPGLTDAAARRVGQCFGGRHRLRP